MTKFEEWRGKCKDKYLAFKDKMGRLKDAICQWAKENPDEAAGLVCSAVFVGGGAVVKGISDKKKEKEEYEERECRQWDPVTGQYYYIKRPMKSKEKLELDRRMANGEKKGQILHDMRLI